MVEKGLKTFLRLVLDGNRSNFVFKNKSELLKSFINIIKFGKIKNITINPNFTPNILALKVKTEILS